MFSLQVLLFMALYTVALAHRYEWFNTRVSNTSCPPLFIIAKIFSIFVLVKIFNHGQKRAFTVAATGRRCVPQPWSSPLSVLNARSIRVHS